VTNKVINICLVTVKTCPWVFILLYYDQTHITSNAGKKLIMMTSTSFETIIIRDSIIQLSTNVFHVNSQKLKQQPPHSVTTEIIFSLNTELIYFRCRFQRPLIFYRLKCVFKNILY